MSSAHGHRYGETELRGGGRGSGWGYWEVTPVTLHGADFSHRGPWCPLASWPTPGVEFPFGFVFYLDKKCAMFTAMEETEL